MPTLSAYPSEPQLVFFDYLQRVLAEAGLPVVAARNEMDAKDVAAHDPAAVFVDVDFFARGGPNALCRIRQATRSAALIAFCHSADPTYAASCMISGADAGISKEAGVAGVL